MSRTFDTVLTRLRELGSSKLAELDALCAEHKQWLWSAVEEANAKRQKLGHPAKQPAAAVSAATVVGAVVEAAASALAHLAAHTPPCPMRCCRLRPLPRHRGAAPGEAALECRPCKL